MHWSSSCPAWVGRQAGTAPGAVVGLPADLPVPVCRETGCLNGVITSDASISSEKLVEMAKGYNIVGKDLISEVSQSAHLEWSPAEHALCHSAECCDHISS